MNKVRCPICDTPMPGNWQEYPQYPFCSPRCKTIDLGRWLGEKYTVAEPADPDRSSDEAEGK